MAGHSLRMLSLSFLLSNLLDSLELTSGKDLYLKTHLFCLYFKNCSDAGFSHQGRLGLVRFRRRNNLVGSGRDPVVNIRGTTRSWLKDAMVDCR